jgi:hypothetical protein
MRHQIDATTPRRETRPTAPIGLLGWRRGDLLCVL